jgi:hypothetical protein
MDEIERSRNRAPDTVTEMNFGLRFAENGASRVTRQTWTTVNVSENCCNPVCALAVGLKPPAMRGEARLRGLWRIISSKTISPRLWNVKPACAGYGGLFLQRPLARCGARRWNALEIQARVNVSENCYKTSQIFRRWQLPTNRRHSISTPDIHECSSACSMRGVYGCPW